MATITSVNPTTATEKQQPSDTGLIFEIRTFWQQFFAAAFLPYRPEQHYMRGPGPACRAKAQYRTSPPPSSAEHVTLS